MMHASIHITSVPLVHHAMTVHHHLLAVFVLPRRTLVILISFLMMPLDFFVLVQTSFRPICFTTPAHKSALDFVCSSSVASSVIFSRPLVIIVISSLISAHLRHILTWVNQMSDASVLPRIIVSLLSILFLLVRLLENLLLVTHLVLVCLFILLLLFLNFKFLF